MKNRPFPERNKHGTAAGEEGASWLAGTSSKASPPKKKKVAVEKIREETQSEDAPCKLSHKPRRSAVLLPKKSVGLCCFFSPHGRRSMFVAGRGGGQGKQPSHTKKRRYCISKKNMCREQRDELPGLHGLCLIEYMRFFVCFFFYCLKTEGGEGGKSFKGPSKTAFAASPAAAKRDIGTLVSTFASSYLHF